MRNGLFHRSAIYTHSLSFHFPLFLPAYLLAPLYQRLIDIVISLFSLVMSLICPPHFASFPWSHSILPMMPYSSNIRTQYNTSEKNQGQKKFPWAEKMVNISPNFHCVTSKPSEFDFPASFSAYFDIRSFFPIPVPPWRRRNFSQITACLFWTPRTCFFFCDVCILGSSNTEKKSKPAIIFSLLFK